MFQSSLELSPECNPPASNLFPTWPGFQSSLELSPECNPAAQVAQGHSAGFQSSLELSPECNGDARLAPWPRWEFQSSLELSPECNGSEPRSTERRPRPRFNPHSSFRPSATYAEQQAVGIFPGFQSSLELSPECNLPKRGRIRRRGLVSILTRAFARVQRLACSARSSASKFQSSLELSPECNKSGYPAVWGAF